MTTSSYNCPNCGAPLHFSPEIQKSKCDYCLSEFTDKELSEINQAIEEKAAKGGLLKEYVCDSCGAQVVTEDTTAATYCYYCHNPVLVTSRLTGQFKPDRIIPFVYDKEKAVGSFLSWAKSKKYVPKEFYSASQLEKITGIYIPYWMAGFQTDLDYAGKGANLRVWTSGNTEYTEVKEFSFVRQGTIDVENVQEVAIRKINKEVLESISPFDEAQAVDFSLSYLSGFFAEKYDIAKEEVEPLLKERVRNYVSILIRESFGNYQNISLEKEKLDLTVKKWNYTLLPVWLLTYHYRGNTYIYAVNGQNGKAYGELPVDKKKLGATSGLIAAAVFAAAAIGGLLIW